MKMGVRKPNIKSRVKARTTGRLKRTVKRTIDPTYGKKGMGWIKDPKKAAYNTVYRRTTIGIGAGHTSKKKTAHRSEAPSYDFSSAPVNRPAPVQHSPLFASQRRIVSSGTLFLSALARGVGVVMLLLSLMQHYTHAPNAYSCLMLGLSLLCVGCGCLLEKPLYRCLLYVLAALCLYRTVSNYVVSAHAQGILNNLTHQLNNLIHL